MSKRIKLVEITWLDAEAAKNGGGWVEDKVDHSTPYMKTFGLLCRPQSYSKNWIWYADTYDHHNGGWGAMARIPKGMIKNIRVVEVIKYDS